MKIGFEPLKKFPKKLIKPIVFIVLVAGGFALAYFTGLREQLTLENVNAQVKTLTEIANSPFGPLLFILTMAVFILVQLPGLIVVVVGAMVYDLSTAFVFSLLGATFGTLIVLLISRVFLRDYFGPKLQNSFLAPYLERIENNGIIALTFLRMVFAICPPLSWLLGATKIRIRDFVIGTILGLTPVILAVTLVVNKLTTIKAMSDLLQLETVLIFLGFILFYGTIVFIRYKYFNRQPQE